MIDTHQHLLYPARFNYPWTENLPPLQGDFRLEEYREAASGLDIEETLFMEADVDPSQSIDEARFFSQLAEDPANKLLGVIASARPEHEGFEAHLEAICHPAVKGIRRVLHTQPDELSRSPLFRQNVARLSGRGFTFDLCVLPRQLEIAAELVDACPNVSFILDHCGVPDIAGAGFDPWRDSLREISRRPNVACKVSGLPAYCAANAVTAETIRPWIEHAVDCFDWDRLVWGGDWPVCNLSASLDQWANLTHEILAEENTENREKILTRNARRIYSLDSGY
jgi:predicted TIM-barrel fold metal-dependent hydrolase